jgi:hypothetical protein
MTNQLHAWQQEIEALIPKSNPHYIAPTIGGDVDPAEV